MEIRTTEELLHVSAKRNFDVRRFLALLMHANAHDELNINLQETKRAKT